MTKSSFLRFPVQFFQSKEDLPCQMMEELSSNIQEANALEVQHLPKRLFLLQSSGPISQDLPAPEMVASLNWRKRGPEAARGGLDVFLVISDTTLDWLPTCSLLLHGGLLRPVTPAWVVLKECVTPNTHMSLIYLLEKFNFEVSWKSRVFIKKVMRLN